MKKELLKFIILFAVAVGSAPAYSAFWQWSKSAGANANADPSINFAEGMSPSSVNDSARALMARAAEYRDDIGGGIILGGTASAYIAGTSQGLASTPNNGQRLAFTVVVTNNAGATLTVDGGNTFAILTATSVPVPAGVLVANATYNASFNVGANGWLLSDFYGNSVTVPLGGLVPYTGATAPNGNFVFAAGQCLSTTTYAAYWALLGSPGSGSCAGGQFRIIDLSGRSPVGLDTMPGFSAANRLTSSATGCGTAMTSVGASCANGIESRSLTLAQIPTGITSSGASLSVSGATTVNLLYNGNLAQNLQGGTTGFGWSNSPSVGTAALSGSTAAQSVTSNNTSGGAHSTVDPNVGVTYLLRVL